MVEYTAIKNYLSRHDIPCVNPKAALIDMDGVLYDSMKKSCRGVVSHPCPYGNQMYQRRILPV